MELSSITLVWTANSNPGDTPYVAEISTDDFSSVNFSSRTLNQDVLFGVGGAGLPLLADCGGRLDTTEAGSNLGHGRDAGGAVGKLSDWGAER